LLVLAVEEKAKVAELIRDFSCLLFAFIIEAKAKANEQKVAEKKAKVAEQKGTERKAAEQKPYQDVALVDPVVEGLRGIFPSTRRCRAPGLIDQRRIPITNGDNDRSMSISCRDEGKLRSGDLRLHNTNIAELYFALCGFEWSSTVRQGREHDFACIRTLAAT
jgi:hypothetical protein